MRDDGRLPARLTEGFRRLSPLKVSFSPSSAQHTPTIIPSPTSPTKSTYGSIMNGSRVVDFDASVPPSASQPHLPDLERNPPLRHPQHQYHHPIELLPEEQYPSEYRTRSLDFFDVSDSNDLDDLIPQEMPNSAERPVTDHDIGNFKSSTMTGPMHEMLDMDFAPRAPQIDPFPQVPGMNTSIQQTQQCDENTRTVPGINHSNIPFGNSDYFLYDTNSRPVSDSYLQRSHLQRNNLWSFPLSQMQNQNVHQAQSPTRSDPINSVEAITLQAFQALRALSRNGQVAAARNNLSPSQEAASSLENLLRQPPARLLNTTTEIDPHLADPLARIASNSRHHEADMALRGKRVSFPPPPLQPLPKKHTFEPPLVHTPYPYVKPTQHATKSALLRPSSFQRRSPAPKSPSFTSPFQSATSLALSVRRRYAPRGLRMVYIPIPPAVAGTFTPSSTHHSRPEKHFASLDFDDAALFIELRKQYYNVLLGDRWTARWWRRWGSARSLRRVAVALADTQGGCTAGGGDVYLEDRLLARFRDTKRGKGRYAWVHWAQKLAGAGLDRRRRSVVDELSAPANDEPGGFPEAWREGLEFVEGWSAGRICLAVAAVVLTSLLALLLWVFVGPDGVGWLSGSGAVEEVGRGGRVATGVLMGVLVLGVGWGGVLVWVGVTWVVM